MSGNSWGCCVGNGTQRSHAVSSVRISLDSFDRDYRKARKIEGQDPRRIRRSTVVRSRMGETGYPGFSPPSTTGRSGNTRRISSGVRMGGFPEILRLVPDNGSPRYMRKSLSRRSEGTLKATFPDWDIPRDTANGRAGRRIVTKWGGPVKMQFFDKWSGILANRSMI